GGVDAGSAHFPIGFGLDPRRVNVKGTRHEMECRGRTRIYSKDRGKRTAVWAPIRRVRSRRHAAGDCGTNWRNPYFVSVARVEYAPIRSASAVPIASGLNRFRVFLAVVCISPFLWFAKI